MMERCAFSLHHLHRCSKIFDRCSEMFKDVRGRLFSLPQVWYYGMRGRPQGSPLRRKGGHAIAPTQKRRPCRHPYAEKVAMPSPLRRKGGHAVEMPKRKQIRLPDYDYSSPGAYFVTVCTLGRRCILSDIRRGDPCGRPSLILTEYGKIVEQCLKQAERPYAVRLKPYVIMPNHIHFICMIDQPRATARVARYAGTYRWCAEITVRKPLS